MDRFGHCNSDTDMSARLEGMRVDNNKPYVGSSGFSDGHGLLVLTERATTLSLLSGSSGFSDGHGLIVLTERAWMA